MDIHEHKSLKAYNTFGIDVKARYFIEINSVDELRRALQLKSYPPRFILSGGSNILLTDDLDALVLHINIKGISILWEDEQQAVIRVMAGENWHSLVQWTLDHDLGGLENLSLIPGNTGTAPIQNIGAYGVELKDVFESCLAMEVESGTLKAFTAIECHFGYRDSYFKHRGKGKYIITSVNLKLSKGKHQLHTGYGAIQSELEARSCPDPGIRDVSMAVIAIRQSKLPDPSKLGNSGSFFKNPVVSDTNFKELAKKFPDLPSYKVSDTEYKIPAGWLIEQCGYKGKRFGDAGVHAKQALVLVNYGNASGQELLELARNIQKDVKKRFGVVLEPEVNIIGQDF